MPWEVLQTQTEIVAIHAALLATSPEGDVLYFGDWVAVTTTSAAPTLCRLHHMESQTDQALAPADIPATSAFCGGQAFMAGGTLLAGGGTVRRPTPPAQPAPHIHDATGHW